MSKPVRLVRGAAQAPEFKCPLCAGTHAAYIFGLKNFRINRCAGCGLTFGQTSSRQDAAVDPAADQGAVPRRRNAGRSEIYHQKLVRAIEAAAFGGPVLVLSAPDDPIASVVEGCGVTVGRVATPADLGPGDWGGLYAGAIVTDALMQVPDPRVALQKIHRHLPTGARLLSTMPLLDRDQARLMGRNWHEWQPWNRWYFNAETLNLLLLSAGFDSVSLHTESRRYSLDDLIDRISPGHARGSWRRGVKAIWRIAPGRLRRVAFPLPSGTAVCTAVAAAPRPETVVSIIVPVFNERATLETMMGRLLAKQLPGIGKEIIIVESNSTDGSRDLVRAYEGHPDIRVVWQSAPRGKGSAVREGIKLATGDILMIQDADLEYDFDDYDGLLAPLLAWQTMFVLGSRHEGSWKMRTFNDEPFTAAVFNLGHWFFKSLMNVLLGTKMSDPFTMFKLFRRDALTGIDFVCDRFDFDIELVMKLVRKGYLPLELPVNYTARAFAEGKKVSVTRDGMTWLWTMLKLRFSPIGRTVL